MDEPLRHRQTKGAETDMLGLTPPRHIPTLPLSDILGAYFRPPELRSFGFLGGDRGNWGGVNWLCKRWVLGVLGR